jgi:outer membrane protein OmpA-like peptidoglycan-associated protein
MQRTSKQSRQRIPGRINNHAPRKDLPTLTLGWAQTGSEILGMVLKLAIAFGGVLSLVYFFFGIHFFPSGLALADSFLFAAIAAGFALLYIFFVAFSAWAGLWILDWRSAPDDAGQARPLRLVCRAVVRFIASSGVFVVLFLITENGTSQPAWSWWIEGTCIVFVVLWSWMHWKTLAPRLGAVLHYTFGESGVVFGSVALFVLACAYSVLLLHADVSNRLIQSAWFSGLLAAVPINIALNLMAGSERKTQRTRIGAGMFAVAGLMLPLLAFPFAGALVDMTFAQYGIRQQDVTLLLSKQNYDSVRAAVTPLPRGLVECELTEPVAISGATTLWHGLGERSLVRFPVQAVSAMAQTTEKMKLTIELDKKGVQVARGSIVPDLCVTLTVNGFETGKHSLSMEAAEDLAYAMKSLKGVADRINQIELVGYADRRQVDGGNVDLPLQRTQAVQKLLKTTPGFGTRVARLIRGEGVVTSKAACSDTLSSKELDTCLTPNRRVEIRLYFRTAA